MEKEKLTIHKNKGETFRCQFNIDGAKNTDAIVRLCLEFSDQKNMFFKGSISEAGECVINIPPMRELENKKGNLYIEAIAENTYFKVYEAEVELKNSVEVKAVKVESTADRGEPLKETKITLETVKVERKNTQPIQETVKEPVPTKEQSKNPYISGQKPSKTAQESENAPNAQNEEKNSKFGSFAEFRKRH